MRSPCIVSVLLASIKTIAAFPTHPAAASLVNHGKRQMSADGATAIFEAIPTFDEKAQYIDVSPGSGHEWQAPGSGDLRGPCPGLNAFANHGFLPRNGYATIQQYIDATMSVVGMGPTLAPFLAVLGAGLDGDLTSWSIGGTPPPGVGGPLAQQGHGLIGSHNKYENDISPTRPDLYQAGNNYITQSSQFQNMINASPGGVVTLDSLTAYRSQLFDKQVANNPYFFNSPFPGLLVQPAAFTFIYRFMANHSAEEPIGTLSYDVIQSWFGIEGSDGNYTARQGYERIPGNWYRRSTTAPYDIPYFLGDVANAARLHPKFLDIGGNQGGKPNTFAGVDLRDLTGGLFNTSSLLEGNNLGCLAFQASSQVKADFLALNALNGVEDVLGGIVTQLGCPKLQGIDESLLEAYDGYKRSNVAA